MRRRQFLGGVAAAAAAAASPPTPTTSSGDEIYEDEIELPHVEINPVTGEFIINDQRMETVQIRYGPGIA